MKRFSFALFSDLIFMIFACFSLFFALFRFFIESLFYAFFFSAVFSLLIALLYFFLRADRLRTESVSSGEKRKRQQVFFNLALSNPESSQELFARIITAYGYSVSQTQNGLFIKEKDSFAVLLFGAGANDTQDLASAVRVCGQRNIILFTNELTPPAAALAQKAGLSVVGSQAVYNLMQLTGIYPENIFPAADMQKVLRRGINLDLSRKKAKRFLFFGIILLFFSTLVAFPAYYIISGSLMVIAALVLKFFGTKTLPEKPF